MPGQCLSSKYMWKCGVQTGFLRGEDGELHLKHGEKRGIFISRIYDSGSRETEWDRLVLDINKNIPIQADVWLFDELQEGKLTKPGTDRPGEPDMQLKLLRARAQYHSNYREMLLFGHGQGRYARLAVEIFAGEGYGDMIFRGYRMTFPKESFTRYLPSIYRNHDPLERFLAVQQSIYLELEQQIDSLARELDYEFCNSGHALMLARWLGWGGLTEWLGWDNRPGKAMDRNTAGGNKKPDKEEETILRRLLAAGISLNSRKGTCGYYTELTSILTGRETLIIEEPENRKATVLVLGQPGDVGERGLEWMRRNVPIGVSMEFVVLHRTDRLDGQYFLDRTACLSKYESELTPGGVPIEKIRLM